MNEDRLITIAIHTYGKAVALKALLDHEGVPSVLQNVNLSSPVVSSGVRVRIKESDLPLALRIIENYEIFIDNAPSSTDDLKTILVPTDFTDYSLDAVKFAFNAAVRSKAKIRLLHSFINPADAKRIQLADTLTFELSESRETEKRLFAEARERMESLESRIKLMIKQGELPPVKFSSEIAEGVPEDVINASARSINPMLITMGTRGAERKEAELVGSVTAELLDVCRYPVFTIPETSPLTDITEVKSIIFFSYLDQSDIMAIDTVCRLFAGLNVSITLVHIPGRKDRGRDTSSELNSLHIYCCQHYPTFTFRAANLSIDNVVDDFRELASQNGVNLIALPNKKRSVFFRFFNPSLAQRLLLKSDIPMLVIPV